MNDAPGVGPRRPRAIGRRTPIDLSAGVTTDSRVLSAERAFPLLVSPRLAGVDLCEWAARDPAAVVAPLIGHGALLFRGFRVDGAAAFERFMRTICPSLLDYKERSTPRRSLGHDIYTSTEYPAHLDIVQHNENSYAATWPLKIAFYCDLPAEAGGETPLADSAEVYRRLAPSTRDRFAALGVMYVRNYGLGVDLSWQEAYQTTDRAAVEAYCRSASIAYEWLDDGRRLRTRQVRPAVARHPSTGEWLWFNQAHLFHTSTLDDATREALHAAYSEEDLPRQTFFGDGSPIPVSLLDEVRDAYRQSMEIFSWRREDVLLLDNMRISHGRKAFRGSRRVLVAMAEPWTASPSY
jgi:alpha-ketoglutarate-dependent taurine dioxygenase